MVDLIDDEWVPIWDGKITRYNGEKTLIYDMECKGGLFKIVAACIHTTDNLFKHLIACNALYWIYLNNKQIWCYPVREDQLNVKHGVMVWERKLMIPITISKGDILRLEITDICRMWEENECPIINHGIQAVLSSYRRVK